MTINSEFYPGIEQKKREEKFRIWRETMEKVNKTVDELGKPIDENIREVIAAFWVNGIETIASCEGHPPQEGKEKYGLPYPWIDVSFPYPELPENISDEEKERIIREWSRKNDNLIRKVLDLLNEFYQQRKPSHYENYISYITLGSGLGYESLVYRLQCIGSELVERLSPEEQRKKHREYLEEFQEFGRFLKRKFFEI